MVSHPVPSITQTATSVCHILWTTKICILEEIHSVCEEQQCDYTFSDLADVSSKTNSQGKGVCGFRVTGPSPLNIFSTEEFCTLAVLQESKTYAAEKLNVGQGCLVLYAYVVDILWFAIKPAGDISSLLLVLLFGISLRSILCIPFEGMECTLC